MVDEKIPYAKNHYQSVFAGIREWQLFEHQLGCTPVKLDGICLRMDKFPPPLPSDSSTNPAATSKVSQPEPPPEPKPPPKEPLGKFLLWVLSEPKTKEEKQKEIKPFDLYDIPKAMKAEGFTVGAKLSQRWLDGRAYQAYVKDADGDDVEGRYADDMIDTKTVKLSWLRQLPAIEKRYQTLRTTLTSDNALKVMKENFRAHLLSERRLFSGEFDALAHCKNDCQTLHKQFQFQRSDVSMLDTLLPLNHKTVSDYGRNIGMSDVTASLANFAFYAAVAKADVSREQYNRYNTPNGKMHCVHSKIKITHIYVYAKDSYSFYDKGKASQYLGHWNKTGVVILTDAAAASWGMKKIMDSSEKDVPWNQRIELENDTYPPFPVDLVGKLLGKDIFYPIRNRDYREWRDKKGRGGDFLIFSDLQLIRLDPPIVVDMGEACQ